jgi:hypothetical protein
MSIEKRNRAKGHVWVVWWKDDLRRSRNKTFDRKADADAFEAKVKLLKRSGELDDLDAGKEPLDDFRARMVVALRRAAPRVKNADAVQAAARSARASCARPPTVETAHARRASTMVGGFDGGRARGTNAPQDPRDAPGHP